MAHDDEAPNAPRHREEDATSSSAAGSSASTAEKKRRRARRRFMKTGAAGSAAVVVTLHHPSARAQYDGKKQITSVLCLIDGDKRKVIPSVCMSVGMIIQKK